MYITKNNMKRKRGTVLLDSIIGVIIIMMLLGVVTKLFISNLDMKKYNEDKGRIIRIAYCIMQEIKYNYKLDEVQKIVGTGIINLELTEDFDQRLVRESIFEMAKGEGVSIKLKNSDSNKVDVIIEINEKNNKIPISETVEFKKAKWMEMLNEEKRE